MIELRKVSVSFVFLFQLVIMIIVSNLIMACGESNTITEYPLQKVDPKTNYGHAWLPLNPTTYSIRNDVVISETIGMLRKYKKCTTISKENWECEYNDGSGRFGCRNGEFWEIPERPDVNYVSRWEYNCIRCEWEIGDNNDVKPWDYIKCIPGWK